MGNNLTQCCQKSHKNQQLNETYISKSSLHSQMNSVTVQEQKRAVTNLGTEKISLVQFLDIKTMQQQILYVQEKFKQKIQPTKPFIVKEIKPIKLIGKGSFGKVYLVNYKGQVYAMKQIKKKQLISTFQIENLYYEKFILSSHNHPFIVKLHYAFQDNIFVNLILDFVPGGELFYHMRKRKQFTPKIAAFYASQIVLVLEFLHKELNVLYRDLKPENILIDKEGYIKLTDFGLSKDASNLCHSFCGTPEYLAPEVIEDVGHSFPVDIWTLGCLIYEMIFGQAPFKSDNRNKLFEMIKKAEVKYPNGADETVVEILQDLLNKNPLKRPKIEDLRSYRFFKEIDWENILNKKVKPPIEPIIMTQTDTRNFDNLLESLAQSSRADRKTNQEEESLFFGFDLQRFET